MQQIRPTYCNYILWMTDRSGRLLYKSVCCLQLLWSLFLRRFSPYSKVVMGEELPPKSFMTDWHSCPYLCSHLKWSRCDMYPCSSYISMHTEGSLFLPLCHEASKTVEGSGSASWLIVPDNLLHHLAFKFTEYLNVLYIRKDFLLLINYI